MREDGFVKSGESKIYYQIRGVGDPLILLMGFGADGNVWEKHASEYEKHFKCVILDNRGVGKSDAPEGPYSTLMMAQDTIAVMDYLEIEKAKVAGISMGGAIAQELAIHHPNRVTCLALISTWPRFNNYAKVVYRNLKKLRVTSNPDTFMELLQLWIFAPPFYEKNLDELRSAQRASASDDHPQTRAGFEGQLDACIDHNTVDRLNQIKIPTLITIGLKDIFTPPEFSEILHREIKGSRMVAFPDGGHVHHWEDLDRFNKLTIDFFLNSDKSLDSTDLKH